jgi:acid phosphatase family membrane protein YuiD
MFAILTNQVLICCLIAWFLAQSLKLPIDYWRTHKWHWGLWFSAGGMPSSHSAMMTATTLGVGLFWGFHTPLFGLAVAVSMVVLYDATGVRRQAGMQARKINVIIDELLAGHPISEKQLKEVLGHSPLEVIGGFVLGVAIALAVWAFWGFPQPIG